MDFWPLYTILQIVSRLQKYYEKSGIRKDLHKKSHEEFLLERLFYSGGLHLLPAKKQVWNTGVYLPD